MGYLLNQKESAPDSFFYGADSVAECLCGATNGRGDAPARGERVYLEHFQERVRDAVEPVLTGMGLSLVEMTLARRKGSTRVCVVIYRQGGVGVDD